MSSFTNSPGASEEDSVKNEEEISLKVELRNARKSSMEELVSEHKCPSSLKIEVSRFVISSSVGGSDDPN